MGELNRSASELPRLRRDDVTGSDGAGAGAVVVVEPTRGRAKRRWARAGLALGSSLVALLAAETALRALGVAPSRYPSTWHVETADKRYGLDLYPSNPRGYFPLDLRDPAVLGRERARDVPHLERAARAPFAVPFEYGAELCRGHAVPARTTRPRVVFIGDSFTEGQGVREEDTFAARLRRRMPDVDVLNCGRRGYDFPALATWFDDHLALTPDVVVYAMVLNDPAQSAAFHARQRYLDDWILDRRRMVTEGDGAPPFWQPRLSAMVEEGWQARRVAAETTRWYREMVEAPNRAGWDATLESLTRMDRAMRARGGAFVVLLWPLLVDLSGEYPFEATHRTIARALRARHIAFHDTLPCFRGIDARTLWVHAADRHPNERAHALFAAEVAPAVRDALVAARRP